MFLWKYRTFWIDKKCSSVLRKIWKNLNKFCKFYWKFRKLLRICWKFYKILIKFKNINENLNFVLLSRLTAGWNMGSSVSFSNFFEFQGAFPPSPSSRQRHWSFCISYCSSKTSAYRDLNSKLSISSQALCRIIYSWPGHLNPVLQCIYLCFELIL